MDIQSLGKSGLIQHLNTNYLQGEPIEDCAITEVGDKYLLHTLDTMVEGIHFDLSYVPLNHLGWKAVVACLSDIYAMNGTPDSLSVALSLSAKFSTKAVEQLYEGITEACHFYKVQLKGGDITPSMTGMSLTCSALGHVEKDKICYRSTAKEGDLLCMTGDLGGAYMGLQVLEREKQVYNSDHSIQPKLTGYEYILGKQLKPMLPLRALNSIREAGIQPTAMLDISDGLASELKWLCKASQVGCKVYQQKITIADEVHEVCKEFYLEPLVVALNGGDDFQLLFTVDKDDYNKIIMLNNVSILGYITPANDGCKLVGQKENELNLKAQGWNE